MTMCAPGTCTLELQTVGRWNPPTQLGSSRVGRLGQQCSDDVCVCVCVTLREHIVDEVREYERGGVVTSLRYRPQISRRLGCLTPLPRCHDSGVSH